MKIPHSISEHLRTRGRFLAPVLALMLFGSADPDRRPMDYFRSPLGIPIVLAGSFAEMRSNHFHSGLDIKTNGRSGYRVYAAADGYVSRISISPGGFGNALYVTHANGYMTVYAHLDRFSQPLNEFIRDVQYRRESFRVDAFPSEGEFPVAKGDVIAFSGNSGSSSGPHLHFEIRNARTGWPENPLLFNLNVPDTRAPRIRRVKLYALGPESGIRAHDIRTGGWSNVRGNGSILLDVERKNGRYEFSRVDRIDVKGRIGLGVQVYDYHNGSNNRLGAYRIELDENGNRLFSSAMESFSFRQTRQINAHVDYGEHVRNRRWIQRSFVLPGNGLPFYESVERGVLKIESGKTYDLEYVISDVDGNEAEFSFAVSAMSSPDSSVEREEAEGPGLTVHYDKPFEARRTDASVRLPVGTVFEDIDFTFDSTPSENGKFYSNVVHVHRADTPVFEAYSLSIVADRLPERLRDKATLAEVKRGGHLSYAGGVYRNGSVIGSLRSFGSFAVVVDSLPPRIRPINISPGKNMSRSSNMRFRVRDDFSGIASYRASVDGEWVLFAYDAKSGMLRHTFDGRIAPGGHTVHLEVEDALGNVQTYEAGFVR